MIFEDAAALTDFLEDICVGALNETGNKITNIVKENVKAIVYDPFTSKVREYERLYEDGGFLGSWVYSTAVNPEGNYNVLVFSDPREIKLNQENFQHGSYGEIGAYSGQDI